MKLPTYREVLEKGKEKVAKQLIPVKVRRARKQGELKLLEMEEVIATTEADLNEACCEEDVKFDRIIELQDKLALQERKCRQYRKILEEMFPED